MAHLFVRHTVADFDAWKPLFDDHDATRRSFGITEAGLHRAVDNPNDLTVVFEVESVDRAREFTESADLRETMQRAGVQGRPDVWFTD